MSKKIKDEVITVRVAGEQKEEYLELCDAYGIPGNELLREVIDAFIHGNLRIVVPKDHKRILKGVHTHVA